MAEAVAARQPVQTQRVDPRRVPAQGGPQGRAPMCQGLSRLQGAVGNRGMHQLLCAGAIKAKLAIGPADDPYEREADRVADEVMRIPEAGVAVRRVPPERQRVCTECEELHRKPAVAVSRAPVRISRMCPECEMEHYGRSAKGRPPVQAKAKPEQEVEPPVQALSGQPEPSSELEPYLARSRGGGQPLSDSVRGYFEARLGYDLGRVRLHTDAAAGHASNQIGAEAFTAGPDVYFAHGRYRPGTWRGDRLLGHELTHVVQQRAAYPIDGESILQGPSARGVVQRSPACPAGREVQSEHPGKCPEVRRDSGETQDTSRVGPVLEEIVASACYLLTNFGVSTATLSRSQILDPVADALLVDPESGARLTGFTDCLGTAATNDALRRRRAESVETFLVDISRIDASRVVIDDAALTEYVDTNLTAAGRARNRSVAIEIVRPPLPRRRRPVEEICSDFLGTCEYYLCRDRKHPCGDQGYYRGYGHKYCERFTTDTRPRMTTAGREWLDCVRVCLQEHLERNVAVDADCGDAKDSAVASHAGCYVRCGLCSLPPGDLTRIEDAVDSEDMDFSQVLETIARCLILPSPPATSGFQVECVMRLGGCSQTRAAGIPTPEEIRSYNDQCRRDIGYTGDDVVPSAEDCERFFGP